MKFCTLIFVYSIHTLANVTWDFIGVIIVVVDVVVKFVKHW